MNLISNRNSSPFVESVFQERKNNFSHSLRKILLHISNDKLIQKLALDEASSCFVSNRIEEIANSIFTDDREKYIESLLNIIMKLGENQNKENISLKLEIESKLANSILKNQNPKLSQIESEMLKKMGGKLIDAKSNETIEFDPSDPNSYHIFAAVDITLYSLKMKLIQTDLKTIKETSSLLFNKSKEIINQVKSQVSEAVKNYYQIKKKLETENSQLSQKITEINESFESTTLPMIEQQVNELKNKYREKNSQKKTIIIELQQELEKIQKENSDLREENKNFKDSVQKLQTQNSEFQELISNLQNQAKTDQQNLSNKSNLIENLQKELQSLKSSNLELTNTKATLEKSLENLTTELTLSEENNKYLNIEVKNLRIELPKEKEANFASITEISNLKSELQAMKKELDAKSVIIATFSKQNNELSTKLSTIDRSFTAYKEENEANQNIVQRNLSKLEKKNQKIKEFKKFYLEANQAFEQYKMKIKSQKEKINDLTSKIADYEKQIAFNADDLKAEKDKIVGMEVTIYQLKSKIDLLKEEKSNLQKQNNNKEISSENANIVNEGETAKDDTHVEQLQKKISELEILLKNTQSNESLLRKIEKLQILNEQQSLIITTIQNISPDLDLNSYPQMLSKLVKAKDFATLVLDTISENSYDSAILKIAQMKTDSVTMDRIRFIFKNTTDQEIVETLKNYQHINFPSNSSLSKKSNSSSKSNKSSTLIGNSNTTLTLMNSSFSSIVKK